MGTGVQRVVLAEPRGFCAGVEKAIKALAWMVRVFEPPVFCYHEIVHNQLVVDQFRAQGVVFVDDVGEVPPGSPLMLSAHGTAPEVVDEARRRGGVVVDAVCPLVTKVHHEVKVRARKGFTVLYIGHAGHEEAVGTMAVAPDAVRLIESEEDLNRLSDLDSPVALLAQTTLSHDEWRGLMEEARRRFPDLWLPGRSDLCFATTNRQAALKAIASEADAIVVIGSANSSNTVALEKVARASGCSRVVRIDQPTELPHDLTGTVGLTAGASAPEALVTAVVNRLAPAQGFSVVSTTTEDEYFPPPPELRELLRGLAAALCVTTAAPAGPVADPVGEDRGMAAADLLVRTVGTAGVGVGPHASEEPGVGALGGIRSTAGVGVGPHASEEPGVGAPGGIRSTAGVGVGPHASEEPGVGAPGGIRSTAGVGVGSHASEEPGVGAPGGIRSTAGVGVGPHASEEPGVGAPGGLSGTAPAPAPAA